MVIGRNDAIPGQKHAGGPPEVDLNRAVGVRAGAQRADDHGALADAPIERIAVVGFKNTTVTGGDYSNIERVGVILFGSTVTAASVSGITYAGKGLGDHIDYAVELGGGAGR